MLAFFDLTIDSHRFSQKMQKSIVTTQETCLNAPFALKYVFLDAKA